METREMESKRSCRRWRHDKLSEFQLGGWVIARTCSAGVFAGRLHCRMGREVILKEARRLWCWSGAASLSQLSIDGPQDKDGCKFPEAVSEVLLTETIEVLPLTNKAKAKIDEVPVWRKE